MAPPFSSALFGEIRSAWPDRPYPLIVDHGTTAAGRVCPAASLYTLGKIHAERLEALAVGPGEVVACHPETWIDWVGMLQACLRQGAAFAPIEPGRRVDRGEWRRAVDAAVELDENGARRWPAARRRGPCSLIAGPPAVEIREAELVVHTDPRIVDPVLKPRDPVWMDSALGPLAKAMAVITLLRAGVEIHLGLTKDQVLARAEDEDRLFDGVGGSSTMAAVRAWACGAG